VRPVWSWWIAAGSVPVLVCARPELHEQLFNPGEVDVVSVAGGGVAFVAFRVLVGVVVADERQVLYDAQVKRVVLA
jgi:hypothetical protein